MGLPEQPWFRKFLVTVAGRKYLTAFVAQSRALRRTQDALLLGMVADARDTAFGRDHGFASIGSVDDFRRAVPVRTFEGFRPYIDRMLKGEADVLIPGKPVMYNTTSGTTDRPKMIPISARYLEQGIAGINRMWFYSCMKDNPRLFDGKSLSAVAPAEDGTVEDGTPYGSISGVSYRNIPAVLKSTHSVTYPIVCMQDYLLKYYTMMRCALAADITYIVSPSPSNIIRFHQTVTENFTDLVRDIRDGTLRKDAAALLSTASLEQIRPLLAASPRRSRHLDRLMEQHGAGLKPHHYWPGVACINIWKQGNFALLTPKVRDLYPEPTVLREFGYQASEGRAGLVLGNDWDYSVLAHHLYHFEFIPESERDSASPCVLQAHEVEQGGRYFILFSNGSGLFRYDINDLVEVTGFYNEVPCIRFLQKGEGVTSITGEKLAEAQVIAAVAEAAAAAQAPVENYVMFCNEAEQLYELFVEFAPGVPAREKAGFVHAVDAALARANREYEGKRGSLRLNAPVLFELTAGSHEKLKQGLVKLAGLKEGQYKDLYLTRKAVVKQILDGLRIV